MFLISFTILTVLSLLSKSSRMSFIQKIFKRKKNNNVESNISVSSAKDDRNLIQQDNNSLSSDVTTDTSDDWTDTSNENGSSKMNDLKHYLHKKKRQERNLLRKCRDVMALEAEIEHLLTLTARAKYHSKALDEEVLNKKCEMRFLKKEAPEGYEAEAKKREPVLYRKYVHAKSATEAKDLLMAIRHRQTGLHFLELMTYTKYLELTHSLKQGKVKKRTSAMMKNKARHFGHLVDEISEREDTGSSGESAESRDETSITVITVSPKEAHSGETGPPNTVPPAPPTPPFFPQMFGIPSPLSRATETTL